MGYFYSKKMVLRCYFALHNRVFQRGLYCVKLQIVRHGAEYDISVFQ